MKHINQLDYLKCIFIILMVIFHLVYINDKYPYIKQIIYTFHMPAFLVISGYLTNVSKEFGAFFKRMLWIFIPYAIMEGGYVIMSTMLPVREGVEEFTLGIMLRKIFVAPIGPYWYLHTLIICSVVYYIINRACRRVNHVSFLIILSMSLGIFAYGFRLLSFANVLYFIAGVAIFRSKLEFLSIFQPSPWAIIPFIALCFSPEGLDRFTLAGFAMTYLIISFLLFLYDWTPSKWRKTGCFIGRNTLVILLFSPIFTMTARIFVPFFSFDPSGLCFTAVTLIFVIVGCMCIAWVMDKIHVSPYFFGEKQVLKRM